MAHVSLATRQGHILRHLTGALQSHSCVLESFGLVPISTSTSTGSQDRAQIWDPALCKYSSNNRLPLMRSCVWSGTSGSYCRMLHVMANRHSLNMFSAAPPSNYHRKRTVTNTGGARKVIEQQETNEEKEKEEEPSRNDTHFDRSLKARKAKNPEHQSVIAHMSDVRTPRSLLNKSQQQKWEVRLTVMFTTACLPYHLMLPSTSVLCY